jgi:putative membrane protein
MPMMYGWWDGSAVPWYGMIFGPVMMIAFIVVTAVIIAWVLRAFGLGWHSDWQVGHTPLDMLKQRFARGEIDRAEYEERRKLS